MTNLLTFSLCVSSAVWRDGHSTGYEPNSELDMAGRFVPTVDLTQDDEDRNSHTSEIQLHLLASANVANY